LEGGVELFDGVAFEFVNDSEEVLKLMMIEAFLLGELIPDVAVGKADGEVVFGEAEFEHGGDGERDELGIGSGRGVADEVGVELVEFATASFLWFFVAEALADLEPLERLGRR